MANVFKRFLKGIALRGETSNPSDNIEGSIFHNSTDQKIRSYVEGAVREFTTNDQTQTLTNKTIDADVNTISDLQVTNLKAGVLDIDLTTTSGSDDTIPSAKATKTYIDDHINDPTGAHAASAVSNIPAGNLAATDVQAALNELQGDVDTNASAISNHISDAVDAHDASAISNIPSGNLAATDIQGAVDELQSDVDTRALASDLTNHINDATDAHDASAISSVPSGNLAATDVQTALDELQTDVDTRALNSALTSHTGASSGVHGVVGSVVGTTDSQILTNKTIDGDDNTISDLALSSIKTNLTDADKFLVRDASGIVVSNTKAVPAGAVVGTSDTQVITAKDIDGGTASNTSRITVPKDTKTNLDALTRKEATLVYASDSDTLYVDDGVTLQPVGSGSADINNQIQGDSVNAESSLGDWLAYADAAAATPVDGTGGSPTLTIARTTTAADVLNGTASFLVTKDAANRQGNGVSLDIIVDRAIQGKPCSIKFNYQSSANFVNGSSSVNSDIKVYIYDITNATLITPYPAWLDGSGLAEISFQAPSNSTSLRLIMHVATTNASAWTFGFDNVFLGLNDPSFIPLSSDWQTYTITPTGSGSNPTVGTTSVNRAMYRREGDSLRIRYNLNVTGAGTAGSGTYLFNLPSGLIVDTNKVTLVTSTTDVLAASVGFGSLGNATTYSGLNVVMYDSTHFASNYQNNTGTFFGSASYSFSNSNIRYSVELLVPIQGWTSGFVSSDVVGQNIPAILRTFKNAGAVTANTTIPTWTTVSLDTVGSFDSSAGTYTVKVPGTYRASFKASTTSGTPIGSIRKNGTIVDTGINSGTKTTVASVLPNLIVGDVITVALDTSLTIGSDNVNTTFEIEKIETPQASLNVRRIAKIADHKAANTDGGTFTSGAYQTRTLNTLVDPFGLVTLSSNQFTLQPGTYRIEASAPAFRVNRHKTKLRNITASSDTLIGSNAFSQSASAYAQDLSIVKGIFSITVTTTFEIQHRCESTLATFGLGNLCNFSADEVYTQVEIEKLL